MRGYFTRPCRNTQAFLQCNPEHAATRIDPPFFSSNSTATQCSPAREFNLRPCRHPERQNAAEKSIIKTWIYRIYVLCLMFRSTARQKLRPSPLHCSLTLIAYRLVARSCHWPAVVAWPCTGDAVGVGSSLFWWTAGCRKIHWCAGAANPH